MPLLLPSRPDKVTVLRKALLAGVLPPVALLEHALDYRKIVTLANPEFLALIDPVDWFCILTVKCSRL